MKFLKIKLYGKIYDDCYFHLYSYINSDNPAIMIWSKQAGLIAKVTIDIDIPSEENITFAEKLNRNYDFKKFVIDMENCKFIEDVIKDYELGEIIEHVKSDGIEYPVYKLNIDKILEYGINLDWKYAKNSTLWLADYIKGAELETFINIQIEHQVKLLEITLKKLTDNMVNDKSIASSSTDEIINIYKNPKHVTWIGWNTKTQKIELHLDNNCISFNNKFTEDDIKLLRDVLYYDKDLLADIELLNEEYI